LKLINVIFSNLIPLLLSIDQINEKLKRGWKGVNGTKYVEKGKREQKVKGRKI
jgi:hypothetical protein